MIPEAFRLLLPFADVVAVIPGLAPGIIAILPHLVLLLVVSVTLVASPRVWWRTLRACARHPGRTLLAVVLVGLAVGLVRAAVALVPVPGPGPSIERTVKGFPVGDWRFAHVRSSSSGPLTAPAVRALDLAPGPALKVIASEGGQVFFALGNRRLACFDLKEESARWTIDLPADLAADPVLFRREVERGDEPELIVPVVMGKTGALLFVRDGAVAGRFELASPPRALCAVDDTLVVAMERALSAIAISGPRAPREVWSERAPGGPAIALAGDENGFFYLLDGKALRSGDLARGHLETVTRVESAARGLCIRAGLAYVLEGSDHEARVRCVDPARPEEDRWSASIEEPRSNGPAVSEFGVIVTTARGFEVRDRFSGALLDRVALAAAPGSAAVATGLSCYALLGDGSVVRYSPGLERIVWSVAVERPEPARTVSSLVPAGRALVAVCSGRAYLLTEREESLGLAWSHAHGGADRAGAARGAQVPLAGEVLRRTPLPGAPASAPLPVEGGWLVARREEGAVRLVRVAYGDDAGDGAETTPITVSAAFEGTLRGLVRHGQRVLLALAGKDGRGRVVAVDSGSATLAVLWESPLAELGRKDVLAASEDSIIVALARSIRSLSVHDGSRRWESGAVEDAEAPLTTGELVVAVGRDDAGAAIVALGARDGEVRWRRDAAGPTGSASLRGGALCVAVSGGEGHGRVLSLDPRDGSIRWEFEAPAPIRGTVSIAEDAVVFRTDGAAHVLNLEGEHVGSIASLAAKKTAPTEGVPAPAVAPGAVVVADGRRVRSVDTAILDAIWEKELPAPIDAVTVIGERVVVTAGSELIALGAGE